MRLFTQKYNCRRNFSGSPPVSGESAFPGCGDASASGVPTAPPFLCAPFPSHCPLPQAPQRVGSTYLILLDLCSDSEKNDMPIL